MAEDRNDARKNMKISADEEPYPDYELNFEGDLVVVRGSQIEQPVKIKGPHSFQLPPLAPDVNVKVVVEHMDHDPGVPTLRIIIKRKNPNA